MKGLSQLPPKLLPLLLLVSSPETASNDPILEAHQLIFKQRVCQVIETESPKDLPQYVRQISLDC